MGFLVAARRFLNDRLSAEQKERLKRFQATRFRGLQSVLGRLLFGRNLRALAVMNATDKWGSHWYATHYEQHFARFRRKPIKLIEIGIGGYEDSWDGGGSLRMWRTYFARGLICGIDICEKSCHREKRIKTFQGSQIDFEFLRGVIDEIGSPDIVIDDGSHINAHMIASFQFLFPLLKPGGVYVMEDLQTSYWKITVGAIKILVEPTPQWDF